MAHGLIEKRGDDTYGATPEGNAVWLFHGAAPAGRRVTDAEMPRSVIDLRYKLPEVGARRVI